MTAIAAAPVGPERVARRTSPGARWVLLSLPMLATLAVVFAVPALREALRLAPLPLAGWVAAVVASAAVIVVVEALRALTRR